MIILTPTATSSYIGKTLWVYRLVSLDPLAKIRDVVEPCCVTVSQDGTFRSIETNKLVNNESSVTPMTLINRYGRNGKEMFLRGFESEKECISHWNTAVRNVMVSIDCEMELLQAAADKAQVSLEGRIL